MDYCRVRVGVDGHERTLLHQSATRAMESDRAVCSMLLKSAIVLSTYFVEGRTVGECWTLCAWESYSAIRMLNLHRTLSGVSDV